MAMYNAGALDQIEPSALPRPLVFAELHRHASEFLILPPTGTIYYGFRVDRPPLDDVRVRRALALAVDALELFQVSALLRPATGGFLPPGIPGHSPGLNLAHDPGQARALLAEAGYPGGRGLRPLQILLPRDPISSLDMYEELLHKQWVEPLGLELASHFLPWCAYLEKLASDPPDVFLGWSQAYYHDPDSMFRHGLARQATGWQNDAYSRLLIEAGRVAEPARRMALYRQADRTLVEEAVLVPMEYTQSYGFLLQPWVKRFPTAPPYRAWMLHEVVVERQ
jgi:oligopeptide transport system substrate-binding protein